MFNKIYIEAKFHFFKNEISNQDELKESEDLKSENVIDSLKNLRFGNELNTDHFNNRYLTCKAMLGFANSCESKTRVLVPIFFRFMK